VSSNLPPGCGKLPGEEEPDCDVCGRPADACLCPECPVCSAHGDPRCYEAHGLVLSEEQQRSRAAVLMMIRAEDEAAEEAWRQSVEDERMAYDYWRSREDG
jgi:predicted nucleic acid-binding Zn ribbon protein